MEKSIQRFFFNYHCILGAVFTMLVRCLHHNDGEQTTRLMAAKIIENLTSTTGRYCKKFVNNDVGLVSLNFILYWSFDIFLLR